MRIGRLLGVVAAAGMLAACGEDRSGGGDEGGSVIEDNGLVPAGAIVSAPDVRPGYTPPTRGVPTQVDSATAVRTGAPQQAPVITPLPPTDSAQR